MLRVPSCNHQCHYVAHYENGTCQTNPFDIPDEQIEVKQLLRSNRSGWAAFPKPLSCLCSAGTSTRGAEAYAQVRRESQND